MNRRTIELGEDAVVRDGILARVKKSVKEFCWKVVRFFIFLAILVAGFNFVGSKVQTPVQNAWAAVIGHWYSTKDLILDRLRSVSGTEYQPAAASREEIQSAVKRFAAKYSVAPVVVYAMMDQESAWRSDRIRFEQSWKDQFSRRWKRESWMNDIEWDMMFSSIGLLQIGYGIHRENCGLKSFTELFSPDVNLDCGLSILSECLQRNKGVNPKAARLRMCFREYNGSGPRAEKYAGEVMARLADYMINDSQQQIFEEGKAVSKLAMLRDGGGSTNLRGGR